MASIRSGVLAAVTGGTIGVAGDVLMQQLEGQQRIDSARSSRVAAYRAWQAPILDVVWRIFDQRILMKGVGGIAAKVAADQLLLAPLFLSSFFVTQSLFEHRTLVESITRAKETFPAAYWCCVHLVTFGVMPTRYRIAWSSVASVAWTAYMSHCNQQARQREGACIQMNADK